MRIFRKYVVDSILPLVTSVSVFKGAIHSFFLDFVFKLGSEIVHFIAQNVIAECQPQSPVSVYLSENERQAVHYVAGAIIRGYLRKARLHQKNKYWISIEKAIKERILEGDVVGVAANSDRCWTEFCNRGALNFVGPLFLDFILAVVKILVSEERPDGSLFHEDVQRALLESPARGLWDQLIGSTLDEDDSIIFMRGIVRSFTTTYGGGVSLKLRNQELACPKVSVPLRKRLAAPNAQQA